jgi:3-hydroxymyristoyl/3-hydroxydecanoyl-(acyl carrier protein) dehydratase
MTFCDLTHIFAGRRLHDGPFAIRNGVQISFAQFQADVALNASALRAAACHRVLLMTQDAYLGAVGVFAIIAAGADVVLAPNDLKTIVDPILETCDLALAEAGGCPVERSLQIAQSSQGASDPPLTLPAELNGDASIVFFTSGSTGAPKEIVKSLRHLNLEAKAVDALLSARVPPSSRIEGTVPHQHAYGMTFRLAWPIATGRTLVGETHLHLESCLAALDGRAMLVTSPAHLSRLDGLESLPDARKPSLVLSAGAVLPQSAVEASQRVLGVAPFEIFGSTETGAIAGRQRTQQDADWTPLPGVAIAANAAGLLTARADYVPEMHQTTADLIEVNPDGSFRLRGRSDSIVKIEGKRVSLQAVEAALLASVLVDDAVALVIDAPLERMAAAVVLSPAGRDLRRELGDLRFQQHLRTELREQLEAAALPRIWRFVETLPQSALGKRRRGDLAALFAQAQPKKWRPKIHSTTAIADGIEIDLSIPPDLSYLEGHFADFPILPGVVQVDWAVAYGRQFLGLSLESAQTFQVKFRRMISPNTRLTLSLHLPRGTARLTFQYAAGGNVFSSGSIPLAAPACDPGRPI